MAYLIRKLSELMISELELPTEISQKEENMEKLAIERKQYHKIINLVQTDLRRKQHEVIALKITLAALKAENEDFCAHYKMGEKKFKAKFVECHRLRKLALDENKKALEREKNSVLQRNDQINQLKLEISMLQDKVVGGECLELQKTDQDKQSQIVEELHQKVTELDSTLIHEISNLQEDLRKKDEELQNAAKNLERTQQALSKEQAERQLLGEQARRKIQELEANEKKLDLKVKELTRQVESWKKEGQLHVKAISKLMENRSEDAELPADHPHPQPAVEQTPTQVCGPSHGLWSCTPSPEMVPLRRLWSRPSPEV